MTERFPRHREPAQLPAGGGVPQADALVGLPGCDQLSVRGGGDVTGCGSQPSECLSRIAISQREATRVLRAHPPPLKQDLPIPEKPDNLDALAVRSGEHSSTVHL